MRIAIQGEKGSFHHSAVIEWYGNSVDIVPCDTFKEVFDAIKNNEADSGIIAIENSLFGSINEVYDLLLKYKIPIVGEIPMRIHQCLIGIDKSINFGSVIHVYSHPVALAQCGTFLDQYLPTAERIENTDTAGSVELIKKLGNPNYLAIASSLAAKLYGCQIIKNSIEDHSTNYTRFLVIEPAGIAPKDANKASIVLKTNHQPGALYEALGIFAKAGINLSKLQSRPIPGKVWRYMFYIDIEINKSSIPSLTEQLNKLNCDVTVLGLYNSATKN